MGNWKVVRKGKIYCAPACGGYCTLAQYRTMKKHAEKMCKQLGKGWKPKLTHNLGWFCAVVKSHTTIHYHDDRSGHNFAPEYSAWIEIEIGGHTFQTINDHKDMKKALAKSIKQARKLMYKILSEIDALEESHVVTK